MTTAPASFEKWLATALDHPVGAPEWYWGEDFAATWGALGLTDQATVAHLTSLFRKPGVLSAYSLDQVARGIWFLISDASPAQPTCALLRREVALAERVGCVRSMTELFRGFVGPAAPGPADAEKNAFHTACYMWWDMFPARGGPRGPEAELQEACLQVMEECLALPAELCQLSALHGLNHWHGEFAERVELAIDGFLAGAPGPSSAMRSYAVGARQGCMQ